MAQIFGKKSEYLTKNDRQSFLIGLASVLFLFVLIYVYKILTSGNNNWEWVIVLSAILIISYLIIKAIAERLLKKSNQFSRGRHGEYDVCDELKKLPNQYSVFRNIKLKNQGDIDIVVSGPSGIFIAEVKSHGGNIYFNPQMQNLERNHRPLEKNFIGQARAEALNLKTYLAQKTGINFIFVNAVLVFSNKKAKLCFSSDATPNVQIIKKESLNNLITTNKPGITSEQLSLINEKLLELV